MSTTKAKRRRRCRGGGGPVWGVRSKVCHCARCTTRRARWRAYQESAAPKPPEKATMFRTRPLRSAPSKWGKRVQRALAADEGGSP